MEITTSLAKKATHEEYFITDYMNIDEYDSLTKLNEIAQKMDELDEDERTAVKLLLENNFVNDIDSAIETPIPEISDLK